MGGEHLILLGLQPEWLNGPPPHLHLLPPRPALPPQQHRLMMEAIDEEVMEGAVSEVPRSYLRWESPSFLAQKKNGKWRKITDASALNKFIRKTPFVMEDQRTLRPLLKPEHKLATIDIEKAYYQVPVSPALRPYLGWSYAGKTYCYNCMPFGIRSAPHTFTVIMSFCVKAIRRKWNVTILAFLDDLLVMHEDGTYLEKAMIQIVSFLEWMGWKINRTKSLMRPCDCVEWLGWNWHAPSLSVTLPALKRSSLLYYLRAMRAALMRNETIPVRKLAAAIGKLNACRFQHRQASLFLARLNALKTRAANRMGWNGMVVLCGEGLLDEVEWWLSTIHRNAPTSLASPPPEATIWTDASKEGWGAHLLRYRANLTVTMHGTWDHRKRTSNNRELTAVLRALRRMKQTEATASVKSVLIRSDNTTTVYDINRQKAAETLRPQLVSLLRFAGRNGIFLRAEHIPGVDNGKADALSRISAAGDYGLRPGVLQQLQREWGVEIDADLFASGWNTQSPTYCSLRRDRNALTRNAWTLAWNQFRLPLIHPPISQISKVLARLRLEKMRALLVLPDWQLQAWSNQLARMTTVTKILGPAEQILIMGHQRSEAPTCLPLGYVRAV
jgi:hypothetical protein